MSKAGLLALASQFAPRFFQIGRGTWLAVAVGLMGVVVLLAVAVFAAFGWLWDQGKALTTGAPEAVRVITSQVEQAVPGAREKLGEVLPAIRPEPPPRDVSGADIGPVPRYPGLARSHWHREGREITVRYEGSADYAAVLDHYAKGFAVQGYAQSVMSATPDAEAHDYRKGDEKVRFEINRLPQGKVKATIVGVLP
jgi:hypothetical protein